ncbi:hypothetical protein SynA1560_00850 [Synechococcus sp. A15-60]|nr:hypothetical protein SynA1560_00850 [Synechococcus sp. A15-60]
MVAPRVAWLFSTESPLAQAAGFFLDSKCSFLAVSGGPHRVSSVGGCMGLALISKSGDILGALLATLTLMA